MYGIYHPSRTERTKARKITIKTLPFYQHIQEGLLIWKFHCCQSATEAVWKAISSQFPSFSIFFPLWRILIRILSTYIWNKPNFIEVITQFWIMECNHLGKHCQVLWNDNSKTVIKTTNHHMLLVHNRVLGKSLILNLQ